jgi:Uma2 family endonuclease
MSLEEYLSGPPDEFKSELVYGELVMCPRPTDSHQDLVHDLGELLKRWVRANDLGKVSYDIDMVLDELKDLVYAPDLLFVAKEHESQRREGRLYGPADLCAEVLSPSDKPRVRRRKFTDYERYGVTWYWIIDPGEQTLEENQLVEDVYVCRSEVEGNDWFQPGLFPGLQFRLAPLIAGDLKAAVKGKAKRLV